MYYVDYTEYQLYIAPYGDAESADTWYESGYSLDPDYLCDATSIAEVDVSDYQALYFESIVDKTFEDPTEVSTYLTDIQGYLREYGLGMAMIPFNYNMYCDYFYSYDNMYDPTETVNWIYEPVIVVGIYLDPEDKLWIGVYSAGAADYDNDYFWVPLAAANNEIVWWNCLSSSACTSLY
jgi:hypothetical protein